MPSCFANPQLMKTLKESSYRIIRLTKTLLVSVNRYIDIFSVIHGYKHKDLQVRTFINKDYTLLCRDLKGQTFVSDL